MNRFDKDLFRSNLLPYTRKAYHAIPGMKHPSILDIGCGTGVSTMELARLSGGKITGIDMDRNALNKLSEKIKDADLSDRVTIREQSMEALHLSGESFDIIWAEGSIQFIGFEKGVTYWKKFLKPGGYLVIHDELPDRDRKKEILHRQGYQLMDELILSEKVWADFYFIPLHRAIKSILKDNPVLTEDLSSALQDIEVFNKNPERCASVVLISKLNTVKP